MKFSEKAENLFNGPMNKWLNFGGNPDTDPDSNTDPDPYHDTGKPCLGGGVHCPSASGFTLISHAN